MTGQQRPMLIVLGGNSDIGLATAREFAAHGHDIVLAARRVERLNPLIADFSIRYGAMVDILEFDVTAFDTHSTFLDSLPRLPDVVLCVVGIMKDQAEAQDNNALILEMINSNYAGPVSILEKFAAAFERRGHGRIIGLSSIAGVRGRASNYLYGSTKAAFTVFLEGLQHRLKRSSIRVDIIKPGFVRTRMTEGLDLPKALLVEPDHLAKKIVSSARYKREIFPDLKWRMIAQIIRHLPQALFLRSKL